MVLKMSTVLTGPFTLPDLASSSCSRWAGATHFDYLRLFRAIQDLVRRGIIEVAEERMWLEDKAADNAGVPETPEQAPSERRPEHLPSLVKAAAELQTPEQAPSERRPEHLP